MKKCLVALLWIAACSVAAAAFAAGESKPKADKDTAKIVVGGVGGGVVIELGSDGKIKVQQPGCEAKSKTEKDNAKIVAGSVKIEAGSTPKIELRQPGGAAKPKGKKPAVPEVKMETFGFGKVIVVGPDGKIETKDFGAELPKEVLDMLPKEIRDRINKGPAAIAPGGGISGRMKIVVDNNGQRQEYEADLGGDGTLKQLPPSVFDEVLKHAGDKLPAEAKEALKAASQAMKAGSEKFQGQAKGNEDIAGKLDKILDRLERLEGEVKALQAKSEKPEEVAKTTAQRGSPDPAPPPTADLPGGLRREICGPLKGHGQRPCPNKKPVVVKSSILGNRL